VLRLQYCFFIELLLVGKLVFLKCNDPIAMVQNSRRACVISAAVYLLALKFALTSAIVSLELPLLDVQVACAHNFLLFSALSLAAEYDSFMCSCACSFSFSQQGQRKEATSRFSFLLSWTVETE